MVFLPRPRLATGFTMGLYILTMLSIPMLLCKRWTSRHIKTIQRTFSVTSRYARGVGNSGRKGGSIGSGGVGATATRSRHRASGVVRRSTPRTAQMNRANCRSGSKVHPSRCTAVIDKTWIRCKGDSVRKGRRRRRQGYKNRLGELRTP